MSSFKLTTTWLREIKEETLVIRTITVSHKTTTNSSQQVMALSQKLAEETLDHSNHHTHSLSKLSKIETASTTLEVV